ncbi:MAG: adenylate/guanylate cyclase domain-containing protein [Planctomycetes bacterium]|nr:adenylate/guanylate cyclase domain-containing protein [Planctomycetota bacterium]
MPTIRCRPDDVAVSAEIGCSLLDALVAAGVPITRACGGNAKCSTCRIAVEDGADACGARPDDEQAMAVRLGFDGATRLACRTRVTGDVSVRRLVLDALDLRLASRLTASAGAVGREAHAAILFADVVGFTPLSEALPPYDIVHLLDRWFALAGEAVAAAGGRIDNYMGDGLMAVFGGGPAAVGAGAQAGNAGEDDPAVCAVRAALGLVDAAAEMDRYARECWGRSFAVRVGVHHGTVVVGTLGAAHNRRETAIGDTVNIAARIEPVNKDLGTSILVSDAVASRLGGRFVLGRTTDVALKGKLGTHRLHEVVGPAPAAL